MNKKHWLLLIMFALFVGGAACDSQSKQKDNPTAMQLIQGKWNFSMDDTLRLNSSDDAATHTELKEKLATIDKSYGFKLTPWALLVYDNGVVYEYLIKSASDDGQTLVLATQLKGTVNDEQWTDYIFTINKNETVSIDIPGKGLLVFRRAR